MISENPNVSLGIVDCSHYTRRIALKDDYHNKRIEVLAYTAAEYNHLETLAKTFIIPDRQNQFIHENFLNNTPVRRIAVSMNKNSAFTGSSINNPFWDQNFDLRQTRTLRGVQPILDFDAAVKCWPYITTMEAMNFQDVNPSLPNDNFRDHYVLVFDLTSMRDSSEFCHHSKMVGEPLRLEIIFPIPLEHVTDLIVLGERMSSVAVDKLVLVGKISKKNNVSLQQIFNRMPLLNYRYRGLFPPTMYQLLTRTLLLFQIPNQPICRVRIG